jgi:hypothetical protein
MGAYSSVHALGILEEIFEQFYVVHGDDEDEGHSHPDGDLQFGIFRFQYVSEDLPNNTNPHNYIFQA